MAERESGPLFMNGCMGFGENPCMRRRKHLCEDSLFVQDTYSNNRIILNASRYQSSQTREKLNFHSFSRIWLPEDAAHWILTKILLP